ncbi:MAG TPA: hypothetical protein ENH91_08810 [Leeuwenhoekiella sp.]|nr:hypothetical protein [Leeuwenhoekiella sp.]
MMGQSRYLLVIAALMCCALCFAQKKSQEIIEAEGITGILVDSDQIFKIDVSTHKTGKIIIKSGIDGETFETMRINSTVKNGILEITASRNPFFKDIDDKLAAHKVMSIVLYITIPEALEFWVDSSLAAVVMQGNYGSIELNLGRGDCQLDHFRGNGTINTRTGNIKVNTQNCIIDASSRHGKENVKNVASGSYHLELKSITGSITVTQSE